MLSVSIIVTNKDTLLSSRMEFIPIQDGGVTINMSSHGMPMSTISMDDISAIEHATESLLAALAIAFDDLNPGRGKQTEPLCLEGMMGSFIPDPMAN